MTTTTPYLDDLLCSIGLDPARVPAGTVGVATAEAYRNLDHDDPKVKSKLQAWSRYRDNDVVLVYEIETEHERGAGLVLRNLHSGPRRAHLTIPPKTKPIVHNLTPALPLIWDTGVVVLCEGPKDARVLHQAEIPAVAYLGAAPSKEFLLMVRRYAHSVVFIPDNDLRPDPRVITRRKFVLKDIAALGLHARPVTLRKVKDPGELVSCPESLEDVRHTVHLQSSLWGGGFHAPSQ